MRKLRVYFFGESVSTQDLALFTRQLAVMLSSGIAIDRALEGAARGQADPYFRWVLEDVQRRILGGNRMSLAMRRHPRVFSAVYCSMVETAEQTGKLQETMTRLGDLTERHLRTQGQLQAVLAYPAVLMTITLSCLAVFMLFVIPQIEPVFAGFGIPLPLMTRLLLGSRYLVAPAVILTLVALLAWWRGQPAWRRLMERKPRWRLAVSRAWLRLPGVGGVLRTLAQARMLISLHDLLEAGTPILKAIPLSAGASPNEYLGQRFALSLEGVKGGMTVAQAFQKTQIFSRITIQLVATGEATATLSALVKQAGEICEEHYQQAIHQATQLLEPIFMVGMGLVVGFIVVAGMLPMVQMITAL